MEKGTAVLDTHRSARHRRRWPRGRRVQFYGCLMAAAAAVCGAPAHLHKGLFSLALRGGTAACDTLPRAGGGAASLPDFTVELQRLARSYRHPCPPRTQPDTPVPVGVSSALERRAWG